MKCLKFVVALLVAICAVLVPVSTDTNLLPPRGKILGLFPIPVIDSSIFCSPVQTYLCCKGLPFRFIDSIKDLICQGVRDSGCDDGTQDFCSADTFLGLIFLKVPLALLSYIKNIICCNDLNNEVIASCQRAFCTNVVNVLCCKGVDILNINSVKYGFCGNISDPCIGYCKNNGNCSFDQVRYEATCTCPEPYFGDRCEFKCCDEQAYQWIEASDGSKPDNAVNGCFTEVCDDLYVARGKIRGGSTDIPGKLITKDKLCYVPDVNIGRVNKVNDYQVLNGSKDSMIWVKAVSADAPRCAVVGVESKDPKWYVGRGMIKNKYGTDSTGYINGDTLYFPYNYSVYYNKLNENDFDYLLCREETK